MFVALAPRQLVNVLLHATTTFIAAWQAPTSALVNQGHDGDKQMESWYQWRFVQHMCAFESALCDLQCLSMHSGTADTALWQYRGNLVHFDAQSPMWE